MSIIPAATACYVCYPKSFCDRCLVHLMVLHSGAVLGRQVSRESEFELLFVDRLFFIPGVNNVCELKA